MEIIVKAMGFRPNVNIVREYIKETGNTFSDVKTLEEVEKFAIWVTCKHIPLEEEQPTEIKTAEEILKPKKTYLSYSVIPDYLRNIVTVKDALSAMEEYAAQFKQEDRIQKAIEIIDELLQKVKGQQKIAEFFIDSTPTGEARNKMCDSNIELLGLIQKTEQYLQQLSQQTKTEK